MNVELLKKVKEYILEEPRRLDMAEWLHRVDPEGENAPPCGTAGCIAGAVCVVNGDAKLSDDGNYFILPHRVPDIAARALGLDHEQACRLFMVGPGWGESFSTYKGQSGHWPDEYGDQYFAADENHENDPDTRADVTARRIDHFIATNGDE